MAARRPRPSATARPVRAAAAPVRAPHRRWAWLIAAASALAALLAYANSLANGFVWDDPIIVHRQLVVFDGIRAVLTPPRDIPQFSPDYYRPVTIASFLLDRAIAGESPLMFHLSTLLAHAAVSLLVAMLAVQLLGSAPGAPFGAALAGLAFALHPIHAESVAWIAGRSDVLATAGVLVALIGTGRTRPSWGGAALSGAGAALALGAKETGVALYPLVLARDLLAGPGLRAGHYLRRYAGIAVAGALYAALRFRALGELVGSAPGTPAVDRTPAEVVAAIGVYIGKLLLPVAQNAYIDHIPVTAAALVTAALFAAGLALAAWRFHTRGEGVPLFALLWIALTLAPSLAIMWKIPDAPLAERYLYAPSVGFCLLLGNLGARVWGRATAPPARAIVTAGAALLLAAAAFATVRRNPVWRDDIALWEDTDAKSRVSGMAARNLATAYQQAGRSADARAAFARALTRRNDARGLQTIHNNLGTLALLDGDHAGARREYEAALAAAPNAADTLFNLGLLELQAGGSTPDAARRAVPYLERARQLNPHDADCEAALGQTYLILGEPERARRHLQRALALQPSERTAAAIRQLLDPHSEQLQ